MLVTADGMTSAPLSPLQSENVPGSIFVIPLGSFIDGIAAQPLNAFWPMVVTPDGMLTLLRALQP